MSDNRNYFKSTEIRGNFYNKNDTTNSINANAEFDGLIKANSDVDAYGNINMKAIPPPGPLPIKSISFSNDFVARLSLSEDYTTSSFSIWVKYSQWASGGTTTIINKYNNLEVSIVNGKLRLGDPDTTSFIDSNDSIPLNAWTHIAVTFDYINNVQKMYINSVLQTNQGTYDNTTNNANDTLFFNNLNGNPNLVSYRAISKYSEVYLFTSIIDQTTVDLLYTTEGDLSNLYPNCPFYFRFAEVVGVGEIADSAVLSPNLNLLLTGTYTLDADIPSITTAPIPTYSSNNITFTHNSVLKTLRASDLVKIIDGTFSNGQVYEGDITVLQDAITLNESNITNLNGTVINQGNLITVNTTNISTNTNNITNLQTKTNNFYVDTNAYYFNAHIKPDLMYSIILDGVSTVGEQLIKFYGNSYIQQLGDNVTNLFKNIQIASGSTLNGITTAQLNYLSSITEDLQPKLNIITTNTNNITTNTTNITNLQTKTANIEVVGGNYYFNAHIRPGLSHSVILDGNSTVGEQLLKFYGNSHIIQYENNITNYMKNIEIASGHSINGISTTKLSYLQNISSDVQTQINTINTNITTNTNSINTINTNITNIENVNTTQTNAINTLTTNLGITNNNINAVDAKYENITHDDLNNPILSKNLLVSLTNLQTQVDNINIISIPRYFSIQYFDPALNGGLTFNHNLDIRIDSQLYKYELYFHPFNASYNYQSELTPIHNSTGLLIRLTNNRVRIKMDNFNIKVVAENYIVTSYTQGYVYCYVY